jgi:proton-coupled amino acid transporter
VLVSALSLHSMSKLVHVRRELLEASQGASTGVPASMAAPASDQGHHADDEAALIAGGRVSLATYGDIGFACFGRWGRVTVNGLLLATQLGFCTGYVLFVAETLAGLIGRWSTRFWIAVLIGPYTLLALIRSYKTLAPVSVAGLGALAIATGVCLTYSGREITRHGTSDSVVFVNWSELPVFVGMIISSFEGIGLALPVEGSMREPRRYTWLLGIVMTVLVFLYSGVGALGYYAFGAGSKSILSLNLPQKSVLVDVVEALMCLAIMFTFPIMMAPVSEVAERTSAFRRWAWGPGDNEDTNRGASGVEAKRNLVRFSLVLFTSALAAAVPAFGLVRALVGSFGGTALMFVLPAAIRLRAIRGTKSERIVDWSLLIFGSCACLFCTTITIIQIAKHPEEKT